MIGGYVNDLAFLESSVFSFIISNLKSGIVFVPTLYIYIYICVCVCVCVCMYVYVCVYVYVIIQTQLKIFVYPL